MQDNLLKASVPAIAMAIALTSGVGAAEPVGPPVRPIPINPSEDGIVIAPVRNPGVVSWLHFGDLHITTSDQRNYADFKRLIVDINTNVKEDINFAFLPGDNADDNTEAEYRLIKLETDQILVPTYSVSGDHDEKGGINFYYKYMEPIPYQSFSIDKYHFAFVSVMSGISSDEKAWLTQDLSVARKAGLQSTIFMHSYKEAPALQDLIQNNDVIMIDAGHTHYNSVANDGHTIYAATRSTGQISEGPVGFSIVNIDDGVVSWKFKPLGDWPFVMITTPSDARLLIDRKQAVHGTSSIHAKVWGDKEVESATFEIDGGSPLMLTQIGNTRIWGGAFDSTTIPDGDHNVVVRVRDATGKTATDTVTFVVNQTGDLEVGERSFGPTGNSIGVYRDKGLLGTQAHPGPGRFWRLVDWLRAML